MLPREIALCWMYFTEIPLCGGFLFIKTYEFNYLAGANIFLNFLWPDFIAAIVDKRGDKEN